MPKKKSGFAPVPIIMVILVLAAFAAEGLFLSRGGGSVDNFVPQFGQRHEGGSLQDLKDNPGTKIVYDENGVSDYFKDDQLGGHN